MIAQGLTSVSGLTVPAHDNLCTGMDKRRGQVFLIEKQNQIKPNPVNVYVTVTKKSFQCLIIERQRNGKMR